MLLMSVHERDDSASRTTESHKNRRVVDDKLTREEAWIPGVEEYALDAMETILKVETFHGVAWSRSPLDKPPTIDRLAPTLDFAEAC
jgi:hypothetical protein